MTRTRRDHMKFLTLIQAVTLLHQHQREIKTASKTASASNTSRPPKHDVKLAWELASHVLMRSLDDVPPQTRRLLLMIDKMVTGECERLQIERLGLPLHAGHGAAAHGLGRLAAKEASASP